MVRLQGFEVMKKRTKPRSDADRDRLSKRNGNSLRLFQIGIVVFLILGALCIFFVSNMDTTIMLLPSNEVPKRFYISSSEDSVVRKPSVRLKDFRPIDIFKKMYNASLQMNYYYIQSSSLASTSAEKVEPISKFKSNLLEKGATE